MYTQYLLLSLCMLFFVSLSGYFMVTVKEKYYLMNNIIMIDCKGVTQEDLDEVELKHFKLGNAEIMAGDEMKICIRENHKLQGTILGAKMTDNSIIIITDHQRVEAISIKDIKNFKVISKYGKFFKMI
ncbi:hypothetical protein SAMN02745975_01349 [Geosporobacter subterraneus DSM 17957]|uniref:Uncharacterized protein n=1 Tax=Geosporobacter subterraneus DSM 17957 TaxID=1121919 RepID=A0A1M6GTW7_9FIRM|nr:hypothetical protein [Geosporobacter subterraneus]SHJ13352.1 hypothetical protein SAMN02745975_01349 [Geosporobacter subterraneus DSM 17957]